MPTRQRWSWLLIIADFGGTGVPTRGTKFRTLWISGGDPDADVVGEAHLPPEIRSVLGEMKKTSDPAILGGGYFGASGALDGWRFRLEFNDGVHFTPTRFPARGWQTAFLSLPLNRPALEARILNISPYQRGGRHAI